MNTTLGSDSLQFVCGRCHTVNRVPVDRLGEQPDCGRCHSPLLTGAPIELDDSNFDRHRVGTQVPLLVDFWAAWCGPCRAMAPVFAQAARDLEPRVRFAKVDTERAPGVAARYQIRSIPSLVLFVGGQEVDRRVGTLGPAELRRWLESAHAAR